jgi:hypothetical protein
MIRRTVLLGTANVVLAFSTLGSMASCAGPPRVPISEIKAHAKRYDGRTVEIIGTLDSGHLGTFLRDKISEDTIRLRLVSSRNSEHYDVVNDSLFDRLRALAAKRELPGEPLDTFEIRIVGRIRVLKVAKRADKKYYPQIESPIEITPIQVLSISQAVARD